MVKEYKIRINSRALLDIQEASDWYNNQLKGLGLRFQHQVISQINSLSKLAMGFNIRYENVHCLVIKKFPFMVHYVLDEENLTVEVFAVFHTSRNPNIWNEREI